MNNTYSSDPALILCFDFIQTKTMFWFKRQNWRRNSLGQKQHSVPLYPAVCCWLWIFQQLLLLLKSVRWLPEEKSAANLWLGPWKTLRFGTARPLRERSVPSGKPTPSWCRVPVQLNYWWLSMTAPSTHTETSAASLCRCIVAKRQDGQIIRMQPWSQVHNKDT